MRAILKKNDQECIAMAIKQESMHRYLLTESVEEIQVMPEKCRKISLMPEKNFI